MRDAKAVVDCFFDRLWNGRELDLADELFDPDCRTRQLQSGGPAESAPRGPEAIKHHVADWLRAFPDLTFAVRQSVAEGDRVATHCALIGTHQESWLGIAATGRRIEVEMMVIHKVRAGRIVEDWVLVESYGVFEQLGLLPSKQELLARA
jgi:predicted ester cyclase